MIVLFQGRAYTLPEAAEDASAVLVAGYGGPFGPAAVAAVIAGALEPSGKLPYSIPRHGGQIPVYHHQKAGSGYRSPLPPHVQQHYLDLRATPRYPFGAGRSYTTFELEGEVGRSEIGTAGTIPLSVLVKNVGERRGATVVQLYMRVGRPGVTQPAQRLAGYARVELDAHREARVVFNVDATQLSYSDAAREMVVEPGPVEYFVGFDAHDQRVEGSFAVTGNRRIITAADRAFLSEVRIDTAD